MSGNPKKPPLVGKKNMSYPSLTSSTKVPTFHPLCTTASLACRETVLRSSVDAICLFSGQRQLAPRNFRKSRPAPGAENRGGVFVVGISAKIQSLLDCCLNVTFGGWIRQKHRMQLICVVECYMVICNNNHQWPKHCSWYQLIFSHQDNNYSRYF